MNAGSKWDVLERFLSLRLNSFFSLFSSFSFMKKAALGQEGFSPIHGDPVAIATRWCYLLMGVGEASGDGEGWVMANYTMLYKSNNKTLTSSSRAPAYLVPKGVPKYPE